MKKKLLIVGAVVVVLLVGLLVWYFTSPSASQEQLYSELDKLQVNTTAVSDEHYKSGSCFDSCAAAGLIATIPETSDFGALYRTYVQKLSENGYTPLTTEADFISPTYHNDGPSGVYLTIDAHGSNKYMLRIRFQNESSQPSMSNRTGQSVSSVSQAMYSLVANTR